MGNRKAIALSLLLLLVLSSQISLASDNWTLNFIERDTMPWSRGSGTPSDSGARLYIYVGSTLVKTFAKIGTDYDYGNTSVDLSNNDPTGQRITLAFYGSGDIIYYLYNINLKKNGQYVKFTPWTATSTVDPTDNAVHYDNGT